MLKFEKCTTIQEEEAAVEVMYSEMADLLNKLDGQMHELHQYYSLRPDLHTIAACDKVLPALLGLES